MSGAEAYPLEGWVAKGKQIEVGHIAIAKPASAQLGIDLTMKTLPPEYPLHAAVDQGGEGPSDIGKNGACRAETAIGLLCCCDAVIHRFDLGEVARSIVQVGRREAWHRTGTGDDRQTLLTRRMIKRPNVPDKGAGIGKVAVMRAC